MDWNEYKTLKLPPLSAGGHSAPEIGMCALEMVSFIEREPHSDRPQCVCPAITFYVQAVNDMASDSQRQRLLPALPRLVGTRTFESDVITARAAKLIEQVRLLAGPTEPTAIQQMDDALASHDLENVGFWAAEALHNYWWREESNNLNYADRLFMQSALRILDSMLAIGPQGNFTKPIPVAELEALA